VASLPIEKARHPTPSSSSRCARTAASTTFAKLSLPSTHETMHLLGPAPHR
jgi:hypothetical protein